jgi:hypothetical protein
VTARDVTDGRYEPMTLLDDTKVVAEEILAPVPEIAKDAFQAELDFLEWRADNEPAHCEEFMAMLADYVRRAKPLVDTYARIARQHPPLMGRFVAIVEPIRRETFGTE